MLLERFLNYSSCQLIHFEFKRTHFFKILNKNSTFLFLKNTEYAHVKHLDGNNSNNAINNLNRHNVKSAQGEGKTKNIARENLIKKIKGKTLCSITGDEEIKVRNDIE